MSERSAGAGRYRLMAWVAASLMAAAVSFSLLRIPIQVPDSLVVMLQAQAAPSAALTNFVGEQGIEVNTPQGEQLVSALRTAAIEMPMLHPHFLPRWAEGWFA